MDRSRPTNAAIVTVLPEMLGGIGRATIGQSPIASFAPKLKDREVTLDYNFKDRRNMTVKISTALANAMLDAIEVSQGASCKFQVWSGAQAATPEEVPAGTLLVSMDLPADWMLAAAAGIKNKQGTWSGVAVASGLAGHYRLTTGAGVGFTTGTVGLADEDPAPPVPYDAEIDNTSIATGQTVAVAAFLYKFPGF